MKLVLAVIIGCLPFNRLKIILYKIMLGYEISPKCRMGYNLVLCHEVKIDSGVVIGNFNLITIHTLELNKKVSIGSRNIFRHLKKLKMAKESSIGNSNRFVRDPAVGDNGTLSLGEKSRITAKHFFDLTSDINIGENTVVGGLDTQMWTHGFDIYRNGIQAPISIKDNCFIAARCLVNLGITIENNNQIGMGTVITKSITSSNGFWVSNQLERKNDCIDISKDPSYILDEVSPENHFYEKQLD